MQTELMTPTIGIGIKNKTARLDNIHQTIGDYS